jgi:hypothetical protein
MGSCTKRRTTMDKERYIYITHNGTDFLPLRWFGNLITKVGSFLVIQGMKLGTTIELLDTEDEWDD